MSQQPHRNPRGEPHFAGQKPSQVPNAALSGFALGEWQQLKVAP